MDNSPNKDILIPVLVGFLLLVLTGGFFLWQSLDNSETGLPEDSTGRENRKDLKIVSPNGGEEFAVGDIVQITWESEGVDNVDIGWTESEINRWILEDIPASRGNYDWAIPDLGQERVVLKIIIQESSPESGGKLYDRSDGLITVVREYRARY